MLGAMAAVITAEKNSTVDAVDTPVTVGIESLFVSCGRMHCLSHQPKKCIMISFKRISGSKGAAGS